MSRSKKPNIDFAAMVVGSQSVVDASKLFQTKAKDFEITVAKQLKDSAIDFRRTFDKCDNVTMELFLVSRLGLEGADALRAAMQLVPMTFLSKRSNLVSKIVNEVLSAGGRECITVSECEAFMSQLSLKCTKFVRRKSHHLAYDDELWRLTGNKMSTGERYYNCEREYIEASDVVFVDRQLHQLFVFLSVHCWVSFSGFAEVLFEYWQQYADEKQREILKKYGFCSQLSRKHISSMFFNAEIEYQLSETHSKEFTFFRNDSDRNALMTAVEKSRVFNPYTHIHSVSCEKKGCGHCWTFDGNWKLGFAHCMYPVSTSVDGFPMLNFPDVCTEEPLYGKAFCKHHCDVANMKGIPIELRAYLQFTSDSALPKPLVEKTNSEHHPVAYAQGTEHFIKDHPAVIELCKTVPEKDTTCNKDTGEKKKLQLWSRGHFFIVRPCGHIDQWQPLFRSESPSQVFIIILTWLFQILKENPVNEWKEIIVCYDNMCHLDALKASQEDLPLPAPYNQMWKTVTKIIDDLHIKNHKDEKCQTIYHSRHVKDVHPHYNLMCAEQVFTWLSRFKKNYLCHEQNSPLLLSTSNSYKKEQIELQSNK